MESLRKWFYKPKKDDTSLLAQFFYADEALNMVASELDSFDGRKDPERCTTLVNQLRQSQDKVLTITNAIMDVLIGDDRANRDFRAKFPEDVLQENLAGQLWFGAECLAAGSSIMNREAESTAMRPLAKALTKSLEHVRNLLRETCLHSNTPNGPLKLNSDESEILLESLKIFDRLFAEFELCYVSAMVPVKSTQEYELQELIGVLFSETLQRALKMKLLAQEMIDDYDPALMFTIPRLAIVSGLLIFPNGPLSIDKQPEEMSEMFRPFRTLLHKIRELLWTLTKKELYTLEKLLCDNEQISDIKSVSDLDINNDLDEFVNRFYNDYPSCKDYVSNFYTVSDNNGEMQADAVDEALNYSTPNNDSDSVETATTSTFRVLSPVHATRNCDTLQDESLPDFDSLKVISVAAATLSSILTTNENPETKKTELESPNDSGIGTENTSLDRSPSLDLFDEKGCVKNSASLTIPCQCAAKPQGQVRLSSVNERKKLLKKRRDKVSEEDSASSDTSSFNSNCVDDEEIALAMQAAEIASRNELRAKFRSSEDLIHRLFVCIAGVADQLQTNFASDLRNILKSVFLMNSSPDAYENESLSPPSLDTSIEYHPTENEVVQNGEFSVDPNILAQEALFDSNVYFHIDENDANADYSEYSNRPRPSDEIEVAARELNEYLNVSEPSLLPPPPQTIIASNRIRNEVIEEVPPIWIPDVEAPKCMSCYVNFTVVKRRHHCRNCGKIFCARCSCNSVPLPKYGHTKPVRVCNKCFVYHLSPFTM